MPYIRIEELLIEVDEQLKFSQHFSSIQKNGARPKDFSRKLMATIISQATNLGVVSMSASAQIVNHHHMLPLSSIHGQGNISSSNAQRVGIRASSLLASYYPR